MIVLADRGFYSYDPFTAAAQEGEQLLWRVSNTLDLPVLESYQDGSFRSELLPSKMKAAVKAGRLPADIDQHRVQGRAADPEEDVLQTGRVSRARGAGFAVSARGVGERTCSSAGDFFAPASKMMPAMSMPGTSAVVIPVLPASG